MRAVFLCVVIAAAPAFADAYDFRLYRLGSPQPGGNLDANGNFRVFARQLAAAMSSVTLMPPETLGHAGFAFSAELSVIDIQQDPKGVNGINLPTQRAVPCEAADVCGTMGG